MKMLEKIGMSVYLIWCNLLVYILRMFEKMYALFGKLEKNRFFNQISLPCIANWLHPLEFSSCGSSLFAAALRRKVIVNFFVIKKKERYRNDEKPNDFFRLPPFLTLKE